jgi:hypothetical protein
MQTKSLIPPESAKGHASTIHGRKGWSTSARPSKVTVPTKANPLAKLVFAEMRRQGVTYAELEHRSNVLISTFKAWRGQGSPGLMSIEAALGALGWTLVPVPRLDSLPPAIVDQLDLIGEHFRTDAETFGAALQAAAVWPKYAKEQLHLTCRPPRGA